MPQMDISHVLLHPMIAGERFTVMRRQETVNNLGKSVITATSVTAIGSVVPTGDNSLVREEAFQTQAKTIKVTTKFRLRGVSKDAGALNYQPDIVVWKGNNYLVRTVDDYTQYGAGMVEAECSSIDLVDQAPGEAAVEPFAVFASGGGLVQTSDGSTVITAS